MDNIDSNLLEKSKLYWNISDELQFVRRVANYIYYAPTSKVYFRLTESWHRGVEDIKSELDWMFFLQSKGVKFAHPVKSIKQNYCEVVEDENTKYIVSVFKEARGNRVIEKEGFNHEMLSNWGEVVGKMHQSTKLYNPDNIKKRPEWNEEEYHQNIMNLCKPEHGKIFNEFKRLESYFEHLKKDKDSYGLIHADLHTGNFHVDEYNQIMSFDFDDCTYNWFIYDIVVFLWALERFELDWKEVQNSIFEGYSKHNQLDEFWLNQMPNFYNYRVILIHYYCMNALEDPKLDLTSREWMTKRINESREYFDSEKTYPF